MESPYQPRTPQSVPGSVPGSSPHPDAVTAAAEALRGAECVFATKGDGWETPTQVESRRMARVAVAAAAPILLAAHEAEVRAKVAAEIRALCPAVPTTAYPDEYGHILSRRGAFLDAARIANPTTTEGKP